MTAACRTDHPDPRGGPSLPGLDRPLQDRGQAHGWHAWTLATLACLLLFFFLGSRGLNEPDEGRYAEIAREMAESGDWLTPRLNGFPHFQKPPLLYWLTALSIRCFGANEWAVRLPSTAAALGTLALVCFIGGTLWGRMAAVTAGLILLTSLEFFVCARLLTPDMLLTFWITLAVVCLVKRGRGGRPIWGWLFFAAMGLGFLTKGPMAFVVPLAAAVSWQLARRRSGDRLGLPWWGGMTLALVIGLSWFAAMSLRYPELLSYFAGDELLRRFGTGAHGRSKPFWFFAAVLPAGFFPWTFAALGMAACVGIRWWRGWRPAPNLWLLAGWIALPFLLLSASGSKLPTYLLPLFPPLALALALWNRRSENCRLWNASYFATAAALGAVALAIPVLEQAAHADLPDAILVLPGLVAILVLVRSQPAVARLLVGLCAAALWLASAHHLDELNDRFERQASVAPLARQTRQAPDFAKASLFACGVRAHGWEFYLQRLVHVTRDGADIVLPPTPEESARLFDSASDCELAMRLSAPSYGLVRNDLFARHFDRAEWRVLDHAGDFLLLASRDAALATAAGAGPRAARP